MLIALGIARFFLSSFSLDECIPVFAPSYQSPPHYKRNVDMLNTTSPKKRSSSDRSSMDDSRSTTACTDADFRTEISNRSDVKTKSPPAKHDQTEVSSVRSGHISRSERRTQSVRTKSVNPPPVCGTSSTGRKSFLKSLFFGSGSNSSQNRRAPINQLAQCQYFVPLEKEAVRNSKSAFEIESTSRNDGLMKKPAQANMMSTFKPSYAEVVMSARVCPLPMRRERSDLCASSVMRLAKHTEQSPGPTCVKSMGIKLEPQKHLVSPKRKPLRPPELANDSMMISNCIEELRSRFPSTNEKRNSTDVSSVSQFMVPQVAYRPRQNSESSQSVGVDTSSYVSRASRRDHRMSVPNLSPEPSNVVVQSAKALKEKLGRNGDGELSTINEGLITPVIRRKQFYQPSTLTSNVIGSPFLENPPVSRRKENSPAGNNHKVGCGTLVSRGREVLEALFSQQQNVLPSGSTDIGLGRRVPDLELM
ncbi:hypothetical protein KIN20_009512 [Parelaphostrongylus tenuis]|uniref:Uncharacterized protein n=1 Tax=Parelaphostrongylus tenuis TaxID=148309 RepID=A0AAD5QNE4_PARTN|nr:hypothetical protein KIN20_009512 [Parelaphostrongylus tenuis]